MHQPGGKNCSSSRVTMLNSDTICNILSPKFSCVCHSLTVLTAIFPDETGLSTSIGAKDDLSSGDNWSYKTCKVPLKSSLSTNQHPTFCRPDVLPVAQPTVCQSTEGKSITFRGLVHSKLTWRSSNFCL